jgi:type II secretory pathway predicted ATPase ExeA
MSSLDHLLQQFEFVRRHVENGRQRVRRVKELIIRLENEGLNTREAEALLKSFEETLRLFEEHYQSIKERLDARPKK